MFDPVAFSPRVRALFVLGQRYAESADLVERAELAVEIANQLSPAEQRMACVLADLFRDVRAVLRDPNRRGKSRRRREAEA